jgi:hypothetical protein
VAREFCRKAADRWAEPERLEAGPGVRHRALQPAGRRWRRADAGGPAKGLGGILPGAAAGTGWPAGGGGGGADGAEEDLPRAPGGEAAAEVLEGAAEGEEGRAEGGGGGEDIWARR